MLPDILAIAGLHATGCQSIASVPRITQFDKAVIGQVCADTIVGNQMIRGISGGQRKRVTTGEMTVGPMKTLFMVRRQIA